MTTHTLTTADLMAATGLHTLAELEAAEDELEAAGLIKISRRPGDTVIVLLDPATKKPLRFRKQKY